MHLIESLNFENETEQNIQENYREYLSMGCGFKSGHQIQKKSLLLSAQEISYAWSYFLI